MKTKLGYIAVAGALMAVTGMVAAGCAARLIPADGTRSSFASQAGQAAAVAASERPLARQVVVPAGGKLQVQIPWPELSSDRQGQFLYGGGNNVAAVEVFLTDSQLNYQSAVVMRNTAVGTAAGTATVTFTNVPSGLATITVQTTSRSLLGDLIIAGAESSTSYTSVTNSQGATVSATPIVGDQSAAFIAFRSQDLLGTTVTNGAPTVYLTTDRVYDTGSRSGANEITDGGSGARAGYGLGAATVSVPLSGTVTATVKVTQVPIFDIALYDANAAAATFSVSNIADSMTLKATDVVLGDSIVATDSALWTSALTKKHAIVDFASSLGHVIPITKVSTNSGTIQFSWTKAFLPTATKLAPLPSYNIFLLRGSAISLIHAGKRTNPTMAMLPDIFDPSSSKLNNASLGIKASAIEKLQLVLKDKFGNPVSDISKNAGLNADVSISPNVTPVSAFTSLLFPGRTYGTVPNAFAVGDLLNKPGIWESNFTQGSTAATDQGATVSITIANGGGDSSPNGQINGLNAIFVPHNLRSNSQINFEVLSSGVSNIKIDMYATQGGATSSANLVATRTLATSLVTAASSSLPLIPSTNNIKTGGALDTTGNGAKIGDITTKGLGSRAVGDQDTVTVTVASGSTTFTGSVNYSWTK